MEWEWLLIPEVITMNFNESEAPAYQQIDVATHTDTTHQPPCPCVLKGHSGVQTILGLWWHGNEWSNFVRNWNNVNWCNFEKKKKWQERIQNCNSGYVIMCLQSNRRKFNFVSVQKVCKKDCLYFSVVQKVAAKSASECCTTDGAHRRGKVHNLCFHRSGPVQARTFLLWQLSTKQYQHFCFHTISVSLRS